MLFPFPFKALKISLLCHLWQLSLFLKHFWYFSTLVPQTANKVGKILLWKNRSAQPLFIDEELRNF